MAIPKAEIIIAQTKTPVAFTSSTLKRIEDATGKNLQEIIDQFRLMAPEEFESDGKTPTPEAISNAARRFSVGFAATFVAGAAGVELDAIPPRDVIPAFNALCPALLQAWNELMGGDDADPKSAAGASGESPPGPASISASSLSSSAGLAPASLEI